MSIPAPNVAEACAFGLALSFWVVTTFIGSPRTWPDEESRTGLSALPLADRQELFKLEFDALQRFASSLSWNMMLQVTLIVTALYAIWHPSDSAIPLSALGFTFDRQPLLTCLAIVLLTVWFHFGLVLHSSIDTRLILWELARDLDGDAIPARSIVSRTRVLRDAGILDAWLTGC
ncbi:MAG: hypothetical protein KF691_03415 [Phycisphaeraceae bacterium]|nr:hypothetical protein [Phycisphaeraceae bacterium]